MNTGAAVIVVAGGGHNTLNVGSEGADFVPFFYNYGINTIILRNRLRRDGYNPQTDAVNDMLQAIKVVRAYAEDWGIDPKKIGAIGFSAGAELTAPRGGEVSSSSTRRTTSPGNPLAKISSRPDFVGLIYPGPTPFRGGAEVADSRRRAAVVHRVRRRRRRRATRVWADEYFAAFLRARIPNLEMHIYGNGRHPGDPLPEGGNMTRRPDGPQRHAVRHVAVPVHRLVPRSRVPAEARRRDEGRARCRHARRESAARRRPGRTRRCRTGSDWTRQLTLPRQTF